MSRARSARLEDLLAPLRADPRRSAVLSDIDGTLAPIVADPSATALVPGAREVLAALAARYALVGCLSGRAAAEARRIVGLGELAYAGNHGLELLAPGAQEVLPAPGAVEGEPRVRAFTDALGTDALAAAGVRREDKGPIQALHWRGAADESAALDVVRGVARRAAAAGLATHWGRKVLEVRPPTAMDKGLALRAMVSEAGARNALYGGDDVTDLDAFAALAQMRAAGELEAAVRVGIASSEGPSQIAEQSDGVVAGPDEYLDVLRSLL